MVKLEASEGDGIMIPSSVLEPCFVCEKSFEVRFFMDDMVWSGELEICLKLLED